MELFTRSNFLLMSVLVALTADPQVRSSFYVHGLHKTCTDIHEVDLQLQLTLPGYFSGWTDRDYEDAIDWAAACSQYGFPHWSPSRIEFLTRRRNDLAKYNQLVATQKNAAAADKQREDEIAVAANAKSFADRLIAENAAAVEVTPPQSSTGILKQAPHSHKTSVAAPMDNSYSETKGDDSPSTPLPRPTEDISDGATDDSGPSIMTYLGGGVTFFVSLVWVVGLIIKNSERKMTERQFANAKRVIDEHTVELNIRRRQLTITQAYGLIDDSKWQKDVVQFSVNVVLPSIGVTAFRDQVSVLVWQYIEQITCDFRASRSGFSVSMHPLDYERLVADELADLGWTTRLTKGSGDQGIDVIAEKLGVKLVIQCKLYSKPVGNAAVQEAIAGKQFESATHAAVVSNAMFTRSAKELAASASVTLLHHEQLRELDLLVPRRISTI